MATISLQTLLPERNKAIDKQPKGRSPIAKLSPEILLRIFAFVQITSWSPNPARKISWIKVTHICRSWRSIAIDSHTLWDTPPTDLQKWTEVMLQRSGAAPLNINLCYFALRSRIISLEEKQMKINTAVFENLDRIRILFIDMDYASLTKLQTFLQEGLIGRLSASSLEELTIASTPEDPDRYPFFLQSNTFNETARLRKISLIESQIDWNLPLLFGLTSFSYRLTSIAPEWTQVPSWQEIAGALSQMPDLQKLQLRMPLTTDEFYSPQLIKSVDLSNLQHLTLDFEFPAQIRSFLTLVIVPGLEEVTIRCADYDDIPESYAKTLDALFDAFPSAFWERICAMRLGANWSSKGKTLDFLDFFRTPLPAKETVPGCLRLELPCKDNKQSKLADHKIRDIVNSLHLFNLTNLTDISLLRADLSAEALTTSLGYLPGLSSITVTGRTGLSLIEALTVVSPRVADKRLHFANLLTMTIQDTILQRDGPGEVATEIHDDFERSILQRQGRGAVLEKLQVVECCSTLSRTLEYITGIDVDIDWEGMVSHYGDGSDDELGEEEEEEEEDEQDEQEREDVWAEDEE